MSTTKILKYTVKESRWGNLYVYGGQGNKRLTQGWIGSSFVDDTVKLLKDAGHEFASFDGGDTWFLVTEFPFWKLLLASTSHSKFFIHAK